MPEFKFDAVRSPLTKGRGLKRRLLPDHSGPGQVRPHTEAWIETWKAIPAAWAIPFAPTQGRGLKLGRVRHSNQGLEFAPTLVRELKHVGGAVAGDRVHVHQHTGAWI